MIVQTGRVHCESTEELAALKDVPEEVSECSKERLVRDLGRLECHATAFSKHTASPAKYLSLGEPTAVLLS